MIDNINWQTRAMYMLIIVFMLFCSVCFSQIKVVQFNAGWNKANDVPWVQSLKDCKTIGYTDVGKDTKAQAKYKIASVPTIIIFKDGEEVARFQADLSFTLTATKEEVQEKIDEVIMSDF
jgi:thiol-disulfide isomerase/thioredoxin|tara:strand:+ start:86 stop:445 length:360 start_codon:yes stop_codon:yes gene_type:complete